MLQNASKMATKKWCSAHTSTLPTLIAYKQWKRPNVSKHQQKSTNAAMKTTLLTISVLGRPFKTDFGETTFTISSSWAPEIWKNFLPSFPTQNQFSTSSLWTLKLEKENENIVRPLDRSLRLQTHSYGTISYSESLLRQATSRTDKFTQTSFLRHLTTIKSLTNASKRIQNGYKKMMFCTHINFTNSDSWKTMKASQCL